MNNDFKYNLNKFEKNFEIFWNKFINFNNNDTIPEINNQTKKIYNLISELNFNFLNLINDDSCKIEIFFLNCIENIKKKEYITNYKIKEWVNNINILKKLQYNISYKIDNIVMLIYLDNYYDDKFIDKNIKKKILNKVVKELFNKNDNKCPNYIDNDFWHDIQFFRSQIQKYSEKEIEIFKSCIQIILNSENKLSLWKLKDEKSIMYHRLLSCYSTLYIYLIPLLTNMENDQKDFNDLLWIVILGSTFDDIIDFNIDLEENSCNILTYSYKNNNLDKYFHNLIYSIYWSLDYYLKVINENENEILKYLLYIITSFIHNDIIIKCLNNKLPINIDLYINTFNKYSFIDLYEVKSNSKTFILFLNQNI